MAIITDLQTSLLDLLHEIKETGIKLIIGGGYGIYLKTDYIRKIKERTLLEEWPESRATNDLDLFLRPELLLDSAKLKPMADAVKKLGYEAVPGAAKYQFYKPGPEGQEPGTVKIDVLTGPRARFHGTGVKTDARRARPNPSIDMHAHPVDEALTLEESLLPIQVDGRLSSGESCHAEVFVPQPFTFVMMKLFAFKDRFNDTDKEFGRYHALDIYSILATTTEEEWKKAKELSSKNHQEPFVAEAGDLVAQYFSSLDQMGLIRLRESRYCREELQLDDFISILQELFPAIGN